VAAGTINFTNPWSSSYYTISVNGVSASSSTSNVLSNAELLDMFTIGATTENSGMQQVSWNFAALNASFGYLGAGDYLLLDYNVSITNDRGMTVSDDINIWITGAQGMVRRRPRSSVRQERPLQAAAVRRFLTVLQGMKPFRPVPQVMRSSAARVTSSMVEQVRTHSHSMRILGKKLSTALTRADLRLTSFNSIKMCFRTGHTYWVPRLSRDRTF
jgi:hypothetical protein